MTNSSDHRPGGASRNIAHNPEAAYPPYGNYAHAVEVPPNARTVVVQQLLEPEWLVEVEAVAARV
ncbi:MAG: hypothetical protein ACRCXL_14085 [Dermatophilaceae bacterium]